MANTSIYNAFSRFWQHVTNKLDEKMDLTSDQTASGIKTFSNGIVIGDATLAYDSENGRITITFEE